MRDVRSIALLSSLLVACGHASRSASAPQPPTRQGTSAVPTKTATTTSVPTSAQLYRLLLSTPFSQNELPPGFTVVGVNPFIPADAPPGGMVEATVKGQGNVTYDVLFDLAGAGGWSPHVFWKAYVQNAGRFGAVAFTPTVPYPARCSYSEVYGRDVSCSALLGTALVNVGEPNPSEQPQTSDVVALLKAAAAHLQHLAG